MANDQKKMVDSITSMDEDFAKWYTDVCKKAELVSYTSVKGCMVIRPYGYAIWENIQRILDGMFKELGTRMLICQCLSLKACFKKRQTMLRALHLNVHG